MRRLVAALALPATALVLAGCAQDSPRDLAVGECLIVSGVGDSGDSVPAVDCTESHEAEVYAVVSVDGPAQYDEDAVIAAVEEQCVARFEEYTGEAYATSSLDIFYTWPLAEAWDAGERGAACAAFVPDDSGAPVMFDGTLRAS